MTAEFQSQTFKVARWCVRKIAEEEDVADEGSDPLHVRMWTAGSVSWEQRARRDMGDVVDVDAEKANWTSSTGTPRGEDRYRPEAIPAPGAPTSTE